MLKNSTKAFLTILLIDSLTNVLFAWFMNIQITQRVFLISVIFSFIIIFVLKQLNIIKD